MKQEINCWVVVFVLRLCLQLGSTLKCTREIESKTLPRIRVRLSQRWRSRAEALSHCPFVTPINLQVMSEVKNTCESCDIFSRLFSPLMITVYLLSAYLWFHFKVAVISCMYCQMFGVVAELSLPLTTKSIFRTAHQFG